MALTYQDAGVDIDKGDSLIERIKPFARRTRTPLVMDGLGGFAGLCALPDGLTDPVLVSGTDGVGTKLKVAFSAAKHDTVGQDLVAMCVNDIVTTGARPLFFLDYFACGKLDVSVAEAVIKGIADGCVLAQCALLGGETAEMPGMYAEGEYDLAGFAVGVVSKSALLGPKRVRAGDRLVAVASSGLHSNGYSLARRVLLDELGLGMGQDVEALGRTLGEELLTPTRIYAAAVQSLSEVLGEQLHAMCHITGGGLVGNLPRVLPRGLVASIALTHEWPAVFRLIQQGGPVNEAEMLRTFNIGIGLVCVVGKEYAAAACDALTQAGEKAWVLGDVVDGSSRDAEPRVHIEEA
jgi:phosphoribosylformylglycinamidine cyclo-ligase